MKKIFGVILTVAVLLGSMSSTVFAATNQTEVVSQNTISKADLQKQLDIVAAKHGGKAVILGKAPSSIDPRLNFDSIEALNNALSTLKVESTSVTGPAAQTNAQGVQANSTFQGTWIGRHNVMLGAATMGVVDQKMIATEWWSNGYGNIFYSIDSQTSYLEASLGISWTEDSHDASVIWPGHTVTATTSGHCTLGVAVKGYLLGYTWNVDVSDNFNRV